ncbi:MAG: hypothetical protein R3B93_02910 [Bacteroidia bacterium]
MMNSHQGTKRIQNHCQRRIKTSGSAEVLLKSELEKGRQAYVVYPLVEESEKMDLLAVVKGHELLERYFTDFRVGIVHGKMKPRQRI